MSEISASELRRKSSEILARVLGGESFVVTRYGRPVAELRPVRAAGVSASDLLDRFRGLEPVDPTKLREDIDAVIDPNMWNTAWSRDA